MSLADFTTSTDICQRLTAVLEHVPELECLDFSGSVGTGVAAFGSVFRHPQSYIPSHILYRWTAKCPCLRSVTFPDGSCWKMKVKAWTRDPQSPRITSNGSDMMNYPKSETWSAKMFEDDLHGRWPNDIDALLPKDDE